MAKPFIYQVLPRIFGNSKYRNQFNGSLNDNGCGKFSSFSAEVLHKLSSFGVSHIWYTGVLRHATQTDFTHHNIPASAQEIVKGIAGSPYAIADCYDVAPYLADNVENRLSEFSALVERTHSAGLKVVIDFIPNHVARDYRSITKPEEIQDFGVQDDVNQSFSPSNNFYYLPGESLKLPIDNQSYQENPAKATGNDCFNAQPSINDWFETVKLNYGYDYRNQIGHYHPIPDTWLKMRHILLYWCSFKVDAFRCDMIELVPLEFWRWVTKEIKAEYPHIQFIGEAYQSEKYADYINAGFDLLYDKVGLYDALVDVISGKNTIARVGEVLHATYPIQQNMLRFMENHDEIRLCSEQMNASPEAGLCAMAFTALVDKAPVMHYFGQEFAEAAAEAEGFSGADGKTTIFDYWAIPSLGYYYGQSIDNELLSLRNQYEKLYSLLKLKVFYEGDYYNLLGANLHCSADFDERYTAAFIRHSEDEFAVCVFNFHKDYHRKLSLKLPQHFFELRGIKQDALTLRDICEGGDPFQVSKAELTGTDTRQGILINLAPWQYKVLYCKPSE